MLLILPVLLQTCRLYIASKSVRCSVSLVPCYFICCLLLLLIYVVVACLCCWFCYCSCFVVAGCLYRFFVAVDACIALSLLLLLLLSFIHRFCCLLTLHPTKHPSQDRYHLSFFTQSDALTNTLHTEETTVRHLTKGKKTKSIPQQYQQQQQQQQQRQ